MKIEKSKTQAGYWEVSGYVGKDFYCGSGETKSKALDRLFAKIKWALN